MPCSVFSDTTNQHFMGVSSVPFMLLTIFETAGVGFESVERLLVNLTSLC